MARRASCSRNSSARVVKAVGIGRYSDLLFSGAAGPDTVILAHVGREGRRCSLYLDFEEGGMEKDGPQSRFSPNYAPSMAFRVEFRPRAEQDLETFFAASFRKPRYAARNG